MSFLTYESTRPWAKAIRAAVLSRKMPPWFADPGAGHFSNDRTLPAADINTIVAWADLGAVEGDPRDKPAPVQWKEGWNIQPDIVFEMPVAYMDIPASGTVEYTYFCHASLVWKDGRHLGHHGRDSSKEVSQARCITVDRLRAASGFHLDERREGRHSVRSSQTREGAR